MTSAKKPADRCHHLLKFVYLHLKANDQPLWLAAEKTGIDYKTLQRAFRGTSDITLGKMEALMNFVGYTMKPTSLDSKETKT